MNFICAVVISCGLGFVAQTNIECVRINENSIKYLMDCSKGVANYCENENTSKSYSKVLVDKTECVKE